MGANNRARTIGLQRSYCLNKEIRPCPSNHCSAVAKSSPRAQKRSNSAHMASRTVHDSARGRPHSLCRRAHLRRLGAHRPLGYGEWYWSEGATVGTYPRVVDRRHRQRPRLVQRVLFWGRSMAPSRARRASTASRCVAHPALGLDRRKWIPRTRGTCRARRHMVRPASWRVKLTKLMASLVPPDPEPMIKALIIATIASLVSTLVNAKPYTQRRAKAQPRSQIACTVLGCSPVPVGCVPRPGRTWSGLPWGFDVIVCRPGARPVR